MRRLALVLAPLAFLLAFPPARADATPPEIAARVGQAQPVGAVSFSALGFKFYDARLYTEGGADFGWDRPFGLELAYTRDISGGLLVRATMRELRRMEGRKADHPELERKIAACFRSVGAGDRYVAVPAGRDGVDFWLNGRKTCALRHPGARDRVLGIWLSDDARDPALSRKLRGIG
ncbi:hypothetical protein PSA7680_03500 [Pseudoruegeria aquimaris]|uniref:Chalcone isomerase domain-containing protein n=1 Tax=Pseudoruegeria aquimaris TaxID=393663 RepID=A0A1Y5TR50_9RHOB|nr:hypothetical protein [Pseudoruegeria aquimaris]SLN66198.1 hypothetical protein PSA7680_03500 [Pseudoruegeria aquimaris]